MKKPAKINNSKDREYQRQSQMKKQYAAIGEFIVEFENTCSTLKDGILMLLHYNGLKKQPLGQILIDNSFMTAQPLIDIYDSMMTETGARKDPVQKEILDQISTEFRQLIKTRNEITHANWFIGYGNASTEFDGKMAGLKGNPSKTHGMNYKKLPGHVDEIIGQTDRIKTLNNMTRKVSACLHMQTINQGRGNFEKNFTKFEQKWTIEKPTS